MRLNYGFEIPQIGVGFLRQSLLILLLCGVCFACNAPQQDGKKTDLTNENKKMTNGELRDKLALALEDMKAKAIEMGIEGVATASVLNSGDTVDWIGEMKVVGSYCNWKEGYNLVAVAWSKCGEVIATGADSGDPNHQTITGELGYAGGAYDEFLHECFEKLHGTIVSCHLKDILLKQEYTFQLQECACGEGTLDINLYAQLATAENPHMPMIIEHLTTDEEYVASVLYVRDRLS